jgi:hypothetical protein
VIKTARAETIAPEVRALIREVAPEAPMYRSYTMAALAARSMIQLSFALLTLGIVSALALFLGAIGLYGVLSCAVANARARSASAWPSARRPQPSAGWWSRKARAS